MPNISPSPRLLPSIDKQALTTQLTQETRNTVSGSEILKGQPRLTAQGVDGFQATKLYHSEQSPYNFVDMPEESTAQEIKQCRKGITTGVGPDGKAVSQCVGGFQMAAVKQVKLSCVYLSEGDGGLYRVLQNSKHFSFPGGGTPHIKQAVCGGHDLQHQMDASGIGTYLPHQEDAKGQALYVNPEHIESMQKASDKDLSNLARGLNPTSLQALKDRLNPDTFKRLEAAYKSLH
jgi:hypothetical protein